MGFRSVLAEDYRDLWISGVTEVSEDREMAYRATMEILEQHDLLAIYNIGGANEGIGRALIEKSCRTRLCM
jgi:LacI family transcriptional regulator